LRSVAARPAESAVEPPTPAPLIQDGSSSTGHRSWLVLGLLLAAGATAAVFFTDNPLYLRVALLAVCWAFVVAAFLAGNRRADQAAAAGREAELRHAYDLELEREVTARHEYEVELESRLRREAEDAMREELAQLRTELAGLAKLQDDLAAVSRLRAELAGLGQLRTEIAALTEMRGELAGLGQLRAELAGLGELRNDLGRMRSELTEQLSGELLIERMVMRAQSVRGPVQSAPEPGDGRTLEGSPSWEQAPAGGWDVDRWEETRVVPAAPVEAAPRPVARPRPVPPMPVRATVRVDEESADADRPPSPIEWLIEESVLEPWVGPQSRSPLEWLGDESPVDAHGRRTGGIPVPSSPEPAPRRHRRAAEPDDEWPDAAPVSSTEPSYAGAAAETSPSGIPAGSASSYDSSAYDDMLFGSAPDISSAPSTTYPPASSHEAPSYETPAYGTPAYESSHGSTSYGSTAYGSAYDASGYSSSVEAPAPVAQPEPQGHARLEQILAESGAEAPSGGRSRRRRYRDEDGETAGDDVLARVLGRG
jgi:hypothetical protein